MGGVLLSMKDVELYKKIGSRIREIRIKKGMTQADVANKGHISLPYVSDAELGKIKMSVGYFLKIIEALQVSADSILRPDIPEVNSLYNKEFSELLEDCSPTEIDSILKIVNELKNTMRSQKDDYDY